MTSYTEMMKEFTMLEWKLTENTQTLTPEHRWHFHAGDYRYNGPYDKKFKPSGYGRLQFDYDVFAETEEECVRKAYTSLKNWFTNEN